MSVTTRTNSFRVRLLIAIELPARDYDALRLPPTILESFLSFSVTNESQIEGNSCNPFYIFWDICLPARCLFLSSSLIVGSKQVKNTLQWGVVKSYFRRSASRMTRATWPWTIPGKHYISSLRCEKFTELRENRNSRWDWRTNVREGLIGSKNN